MKILNQRLGIKRKQTALTNSSLKTKPTDYKEGLKLFEGTLNKPPPLMYTVETIETGDRMLLSIVSAATNLMKFFGKIGTLIEGRMNLMQNVIKSRVELEEEKGNKEKGS